MKKVGVKIVQGEEWQVEGDLLLKKRKVYMPKDKELRVEIIQLYHNILVAEHGEKQKMMELVTRNYWQLEIIRDVERYVEGCNICQRMKNRTERKVEDNRVSNKELLVAGSNERCRKICGRI